MLSFVKRCLDQAEPIGDLPDWLSGLLRVRGIRTEAEAERFLHPSLTQLHDPFLMPDMEKVVGMLRKAAKEHLPVIVYGDYDADGVCATSIMLETLRDMGVEADFRIPSRHGEGYGLNADAVREMAETHKILLTVDCGITNHEEVKLARLLGMQVIVTDHHELAPTPSPADAVLNPLLGNYPFRRLCGAGVALKITQALLGMEGVCRRLELAAIATVADVVPLIDENRVIVKEGLQLMAQTVRPGLRNLLTLAEIRPPFNAGHIAFRLAPRINAGGRLEDASQGVRILTTTDETEGEKIASHLHAVNAERQGVEQQIIQEALALMPAQTDFRQDRVIIVAGEGWNHGIIGLAAGKICEKYHYPTVVLTGDENGCYVGSCRSVQGVNIHAALSSCMDLFIRFGGHEMAAGLTIARENLPAFRRRLNAWIRENCDIACCLPRAEYDWEVALSDLSLEMVDQLELLQPTGCGNPNPVFLVRDAQVQSMRRVGKTQEHLKLAVLRDSVLLDGIAFGQGAMADSGCRYLDLLFTPDRNVYNGRVSLQMKVDALRPAGGRAALPGERTLFPLLLQEIQELSSNDNRSEREPLSVPVLTLDRLREVTEDRFGVLMITHTVLPKDITDALNCDAAVGFTAEERPFNTLLCGCLPSKLQDLWSMVVFMDGMLPGEAEAIAKACPHAKLRRLPPQAALTALLREIRPDRDVCGRLYRLVRRGEYHALQQLAEAAGCSEYRAAAALTVLHSLHCVTFAWSPFTLGLREKDNDRKLEEDPVMQWMNQINENN